MSSFVSGYIHDLSAVKDNVRLRVRILSTWMQPLFKTPQVINMEMIVIDEKASRHSYQFFSTNTTMQATVRMALVNQFKDRLREGNTVTLQRYSLGEIQPKFRIVANPLRLSFLSNTECAECSDFTGSKHGFLFRPFKTIVELKKEEDGQFDVIGRVIACEDLDNYDKNGRAGKKKPLTLIDAEGTELRCTLWGVYAQQFSDFLNKCDDHGKIIVVVQLAMTKIWDAKMCIQNGFHGTKLFLFNGNKTIDTAEFPEVEAFRLSLIAVKGPAESEHTASRISTASKNSTKDDFVTKFPLKNIAELLDVQQGVPSIIVGTICAIQEEEGWWYLGCRACRKKLVKSSDIVDLESDTKQTPTAGANEWWCSKCLSTVTSVKTQFRLQVRVQDETGTVSVSLFNDEVQAILNNVTAYQLVDKYGKGDGAFPAEILEMLDKKFVLKVSIDGKNKEKVMPVFNVLRLSNDPDIIKSVCEHATPLKPETEATSSKATDVTPFDLESQTDENTTPQNVSKNGNADIDKSPSETKSQEKRKAEEIEKTVLAYEEENSSTKKNKFVLDKEIKVEKP
ncbi:replication protein A 70 kDa DNA-binding subunit B [Artemisia annua]|uniref:Replication protein A 70 kDa DNA-binding subunit B n=1 Tax=Artemisia annua TaxID=35608 RepID=A0A2U1LT37_ARTAN|nr:replication protein A 70 kDa DNA-binding subunit B [Artemisia annua]